MRRVAGKHIGVLIAVFAVFSCFYERNTQRQAFGRRGADLVQTMVQILNKMSTKERKKQFVFTPYHDMCLTP